MADDKLILQGVSSGLNDSRFSDVTIECGGRIWHAHRVIICPRSSYFLACLNGSFKESMQGRVTLLGDRPDAVDAALTYLYCGRYDEAKYEATTPPLILHIDVHIFAVKRGVTGLADAASKNFSARLQTDWNHPVFSDAIQQLWTGERAGTAHDDKEESKPSDILSEGVCGATLEALGPLLVNTAGMKSQSLFCEPTANPQKPESRSNEHFNRVASEVPGFGRDLCEWLVKNYRKSGTKPATWYNCKSCGQENWC